MDSNVPRELELQRRAQDRMELMLVRRPGRMSLGLAVLLMAVCAPSCSDDAPSAPTRLVDGFPASPPPVVLEGVDEPSVATRVRTRRGDAVPAGSRSASCISSIGGPADGTVVERVGVSGVSVTFLGPGGRNAHGCDASVAEPDAHGTWCGQAFGRLEAGRLRDPRLSLSCSDANGNKLGFAWVQPAIDAKYVVVRQPGYAEVYAVASGAPVRVTTTDVDITTATAALSISEHAGDGHRLRAYTMEAQVAG